MPGVSVYYVWNYSILRCSGCCTVTCSKQKTSQDFCNAGNLGNGQWEFSGLSVLGPRGWIGESVLFKMWIGVGWLSEIGHVRCLLMAEEEEEAEAQERRKRDRGRPRHALFFCAGGTEWKDVRRAGETIKILI